MNTVFLFVTFLLLGYYLSVYVSKPTVKNGRQVPNRLPTLRIRNVEILPCIRIHVRSRTYWFHHWFYLTVITLSVFLVYDNLMHYTPAKAAAGAAMGGIFQGLRYPDRFKFRHPRQNHI